MEDKTNTSGKFDLGQRVTEALEDMEAMLNSEINISQTQSQIPIPTNVPTPTQITTAEENQIYETLPKNIANSTPQISTAEVNQMYETLLETCSENSSKLSSPTSSCEKDLSLDRSKSQSSMSSPPTSPEVQPVSIQNSNRQSKRERFELEYKLKIRHSELSKSLKSASPFSASKKSVLEGKCNSVPVSPMKSFQQPDSTDSFTDATLTNPPTSFSYHSPTSNSFNDLKDDQICDSTSKILEFLASKVDLLAVSINTIQFNLRTISETVQKSLEEKRTLKENIYNEDTTSKRYVDEKLDYLEKKLDSYKHSFQKENQALIADNMQLREKLDNYILAETEREERIKECLNCPVNPCATDVQPLREEFHNALYELD